MEIVCVCGGSYKCFYLNGFKNLAKCDLLIFNFGIIYDYIEKEELKEEIVTKELRFLSTALNCVVVAGIRVKRGKKWQKSIIVCKGNKIDIYSTKFGAKIELGNRFFVVGDEKTDYLNFDKIVLSEQRISPNIKSCSIKKRYIFCDKFGLTLVFNKKIERKFHKYSKIILK